MSEQDLSALRARMDDINSALVELYEKRFELCRQIAATKEELGLPIIDRSRESLIVSRIRGTIGSLEFSEHIIPIFEKTLEESRKYQSELLYPVIALIGMPGCGKSTVGRLLAAGLGRRFIDCDDAFSEKYGMSPAQVIEKDGEKVFRTMETDVLKEITSNCFGSVLALGGGAVTVPENLELLKAAKAKIILVNRKLSELDTDGRPLSEEKGTAALYAEREKLYHEWASDEVLNDIPENAAAGIIELLKCM